MTRRTIIIGDLHGCLSEAEELLDKCKATADDRVILLGDLVDRGPDSAGCVDLAMRLQARQGAPACILGNHEEKMLFYNDIEKQKLHVNVQVATHIATRQQLEPKHYDYFRTLPLYLRLPEYNAVCVHAGVFPNRTIEEQDPRHLLHVQMIKPYETDDRGTRRVNNKSVWASKVPEGEDGWHFWTHFWTGPERIIFGHSVLNKPLLTDKAVGLDGGACFGLELWGLVLPDWEVISIKGRGAIDNKDLARRGNRDRKLHLIHDDVGTY